MYSQQAGRKRMGDRQTDEDKKGGRGQRKEGRGERRSIGQKDLLLFSLL